MRFELTGNAFAIPLESGWNIIGNPFDVDVLWSDVRALNAIDADLLWLFDGTNKEATRLEPYEGYYYHNSRNLSSLSIPYPRTSLPAGGRAKAPMSADQLLRLDLVSAEGDLLSSVRVGIVAGAEVGQDYYDQYAPRHGFASASLLVEASGEADRPRYLAVEARPEVGAGQLYPLLIEGEAGKALTLNRGPADAFEGIELYLVDRSSGQFIDLRKEETIPITLEEEDQRYALVMGSAAFIEEQRALLPPSALRLDAGYPNPFSDQVRIGYALPEGQQVEVAIYDVLGRKVQVLVEGEQGAGVYEVAWDGNSESGAKVASGLYFVVLTSKQERHTKAIVRK